MAGLNGKTGEVLRWLVGIAAAAVVGYYTSIGAINSEIATIKAKQESQFSEVLRRLDVMQTDIRDLRNSR